MRKSRSLLILLLCSFLRGFSQGQTTAVLPIIPQPQELILKSGNFTLSPETKIVATANGPQNEIEFLNDYLEHYYGFKLKIVTEIPDNNYILFRNPNWQAETPKSIRYLSLPESYNLQISEKEIHITAEKNS